MTTTPTKTITYGHMNINYTQQQDLIYWLEYCVDQQTDDNNLEELKALIALVSGNSSREYNHED